MPINQFDPPPDLLAKQKSDLKTQFYKFDETNSHLYESDETKPSVKLNLEEQLKAGAHYVFNRDEIAQTQQPLWQKFIGLPQQQKSNGLTLFNRIVYFGSLAFIPVTIKNVLGKGLEILLLSLEILARRGVERLIDNFPNRENTSNELLRSLKQVGSSLLIGVLSATFYLAKLVRVTVRLVTSPLRSAEEAHIIGGMPLRLASFVGSLASYVAIAVFAAPLLLTQGLAIIIPKVASAALSGLAQVTSALGLNVVAATTGLNVAAIGAGSIAAGLALASGALKLIGLAISKAISAMTKQPKNLTITQAGTDVIISSSDKQIENTLSTVCIRGDKKGEIVADGKREVAAEEQKAIKHKQTYSLFASGSVKRDPVTHFPGEEYDNSLSFNKNC